MLLRIGTEALFSCSTYSSILKFWFGTGIVVLMPKAGWNEYAAMQRSLSPCTPRAEVLAQWKSMSAVARVTYFQTRGVTTAADAHCFCAKAQQGAGWSWQWCGGYGSCLCRKHVSFSNLIVLFAVQFGSWLFGSSVGASDNSMSECGGCVWLVAWHA